MSDDFQTPESAEPASPDGQPVEFYIIYDDGSVETQTLETGGQPILSKPGRIVSYSEYQARLAQLEAENQAYIDELHRQEQARMKADYDALRAAGIPEATARRITGYTGP